jgi:predicted Zn-dependent protease
VTKVLSEFESLLSTLIETETGRRDFLRAVPLLLASVASGCASEKSRLREGDNSGQETQLTVDDEKRMAQEALIEIRKDYPRAPDPELQNYLNSVGQKMVQANKMVGHPYTYSFTVVNVSQVNAFALPAGTIFVTAPLIAMTESEAELAGVIGHELGHVKARHVAERIERSKKATASNWFYGAGGGLLGGVAGFGLGKLMCPPSDSSCLAKATALGAAAGVGGGLLVHKYKFMANSRENEMEADRIGFRASVQSGYAPSHVGDFYNKLERMEEQSKAGKTQMLSSLSDAVSTHPPSKERVEQIGQLVAETPKPVHAIVSSKDFDRARRRAQALASKG